MTQHLHHLHAIGRPALRDRLADIIDQAIAMLDAIDSEPDFEAETGVDANDNPISLQGVDRVPAKHITMRRAA